MRGLKVRISGHLALFEHLDGLMSLHSQQQIIIDHGSVLDVIEWLAAEYMRMQQKGAEHEQLQPYTECLAYINTVVLAA